MEAAQARLDAGRFKHHPHCVVCWDRHPFGLQVDYRVTGVHGVEGVFGCGKSYEGYEGVVHGGIVSSLLDGAMASCMLAMGLDAYTAELRVRYRGKVRTGRPAVLRGRWLRGEGPLHLLTPPWNRTASSWPVLGPNSSRNAGPGPPAPARKQRPCAIFCSQARKRLV